MNIALFLEQSFDPNAGGVQRSTSKLAKIFRDKGHSVLIISSSSVITIESWDGIPIVNVDIRKDESALVQIFLRYNITLVINQAGYSLGITKILKRCSGKETKIINTLRINPLNFYENSNTFISSFLKKYKVGFLNNFVLEKIILGYHLIKQKYELNCIINNTDSFVMLSNRFKSELFFLAPAVKKYDYKIHGINNPFQLPNIDLSSIDKENVILFVGRLNILQKRVDLLMEIWAKLHSLLPEWKFWVVGDGESRSYMESYCEQNKLDRVTFFGKDDPNDYYKKAKIFHMTSAFEGFGNVLVEAQSYGCVPILFNSYTAAMDIVTEQENGALVVPFDIDEYVSKTLELINNPLKLNKLSISANESVTRFSYEKTYEKWNGIFKEIC